MKKIRLYLDTSVISHLEALDTPEKMEDALALWEKLKAGLYDVVLSDTVFIEIDRCHQPKRDIMYRFLEEIEFTVIGSNDIIREIANEVIKQEILTLKSYEDCMHLGSAIYGDCDCIVSLNFKHLVNIKTVKGVRAITTLLNYKNIDILPPSMFI